jgi:hypothetical protein
MIRKFSTVLLVLFLLSACQTSDSNTITLKEVLSSFAEQQLSLKEIKVSNKNIFGMKFNGVRPSSYELGNKKLLIYIYSSTKNREKGLEDFSNKTENANMASYRFYEVKNVLIFYVYEKDLNIEIDKRIQKIVSNLNGS